MAGPAEQPLQQLIIGGRHLPNGLLPCFGCGFDLRGSAPAGRCPECGQTYRREALYRDVVMQKLKHIFDDVNFVFAAAMGIGHLSLCLIIAQLLSGHRVDAAVPQSGRRPICREATRMSSGKRC